jgi:hypothetical protein
MPAVLSSMSPAISLAAFDEILPAIVPSPLEKKNWSRTRRGRDSRRW